MSERWQALAFSAVLVALGAGLGPGCLDARSSAEHEADVLQCTKCHGDPNRPGTREERAAPPHDLKSNSLSVYPGVGAHQIHLNPGTTHSAFQCTECHIVPKRTEDKGHADSAAPAELTFGPLATQGKDATSPPRSPKYDPTTRNCSDTYCHRNADEVWTAPRESKDACGTCHTLPPAAPHPQNDRCYACHSEVVDVDRNIIAPSLHVNGKIDVKKVTCNLCHGSDQSPAPPKDLEGNTASTAIGVGAHQAHLAGGAHSRKVECTECHLVPNDVNDPSHFGPPPAELTFSGVARASGREPVWDRDIKRCSDAWCHSPMDTTGQSPEWTSQAGNLPCTGCHSTPPPAPHPQMTQCSTCHVDVVESDNKTMKNRDLHVDGQIEVTVPKLCNGCHGGTGNPGDDRAPPKDVEGNTDTTSPGVGAHQSHLKPSTWHRQIQCNECHIVPNAWSDVGHADTPRPAELNFSGVALSFSATPAYAAGTCSQVPCHGDKFPNPSGGTNTTPTWTQVDGSIGNSCSGVANACHALPPKTNNIFHAALTDGDLSTCNGCHSHVNTNGTFNNADLHIDGDVEF